MDITFILSAIVFTLLAIVVATSIFNGSSSSFDFVKACFGYTGEAKAGGLDKSAPRENGYIPDKKKTKAVDDGTEVNGSSHDHWDVVKQEESYSSLGTAELATIVEDITPSPAGSSRDMSFDSSSEASSTRGHPVFIGLSEKELLKCAFSSQTEGATESPGSDADEMEADADDLPLQYVPGMLRTSQMQMMMSKDELEEEQRVQQEQLAAIFKLLKDNKETFGDVSEGDIEEQLKLYSVP